MAVHLLIIRRLAALAALIAGAAFGGNWAGAAFAALALVLVIPDIRRRSRVPPPVAITGGRGKWELARKRLLTFGEAPGWALYLFGLIDLIFAWPSARLVGLIAIALGLFDHVRGIRRAWREAETKAPG